MVKNANKDINLNKNNSNQTIKNNSEMSSFVDEDLIIDAEEDFRVLTCTDSEDTIQTRKDTRKFESQRLNFLYTSSDAIRYPIENDEYLDEINPNDLMPKKVQTEIHQNRTNIINNGKLSLKDLSDKKPIDSIENSCEEPNNLQSIDLSASEKYEVNNETSKIKFIDTKMNSKNQITKLNQEENKAKNFDLENNNENINNFNNVKANKEINESLNLKEKSISIVNKDKILKCLKLNNDSRASKSSFNNIVNYSSNNVLTNHSKGRNKSNGKTKTIFTIMSEEIFNQVANKKTIQELNKKENFNVYEKLINENMLQKIGEKMSKDAKQISNNFLTRNIKDAKLREFKKKMNYTTNSEHILSVTRPQSALSSDKPNSFLSKNNNEKDFKSNGKRVRSPEKFFEDQIKWEEAKQSVLERERIKYYDKTNCLLQEKPVINKKSVDLATKKYTRFNCFMKNNIFKKDKSKEKTENKDIHCYLTKMKIKNFKRNKDFIYKSLHTSPLNQKQLPEKEIRNLIEKLYNEKKKQSKSRSFSNEIENMEKLRYFQISDSSNLVILKDFLDKFFFTLQEAKLIEAKEKKLKNNLFISYEEFNTLLHKAGFLKFNHNKQTESEGLKKNEPKNYMNDKLFMTDLKLKEQESVLVKDAWKILISQNLEDSNNLLDLNILVIFLIAILGIYKGDENKDSTGQANANLRTIDLNVNDKSNILLDNNANNNSNELIAKTNNESTINNATNNKLNRNHFTQPDQKNSFVMTFARTPLASHSNFNYQNLNQSKNKELLYVSLDNLNHLNKDNKAINNFTNPISNNAKSKIQENSSEKIKMENAYLLSMIAEIKKFFPNFNYKNLVYNKYVTNQIRVIFRELYENWADKVFTNKKTKRSISVESKIKEANFSFKPKLFKSTITHCKRYRDNILINHNSGCGSFSNEKVEENNSNFLTERNRKVVTLEEVHQNLKIKKERGLEIERAEKFKKEMQECTFSPKISTPKLNASEIAEKLYSEARSISNKKAKLLEERKALEEESISLFLYSPKIKTLDKAIFTKSPIRNDPNLRINYERYEKSRIDKKLREILNKTGSNINTIKNIEGCLDEEKKDEKRPRFRFDNEQHNYKNTLDSKFKIKEIKRISNLKNNNIKSKIFSKSNTKTNFNVNKTCRDDNDLNCLDNIIKIILDVQVAKNKKFKFEFLSNQDPVILSQRFILQNELLDLSEFKKKDIFDQINNEIKKYKNNSRLFLSQIQS